MALLTSEPRVASAKATSATSCIGLSKQSFNAAMKKEGKVASFLYKLLEERQGVRERRNLRERSASRNSTHNYLNRGNSCTNRGDGSPLVNGTKSNSTSDNDKENQLRGFGGLKDTIDDGKKCGEATSTPTTDKTAFTTKGQEAMYKTPCTYAENAYYERSASGSIEGTPSSSFFSRQEVEPVTLTKSLTCTKSINGEKILNDKYVTKGRLGKGSYGEVLEVKDQSERTFAMKCLQRSYLRRIPAANLLEVEVMQTLRHPNIVALYEVIDDPRCSTVFMIQEYMSRPLMPDQLMNQPIPAQECRQYFRDVLRGIAYLHACNIVHRDIKPQNILISSDGIAKIGDFGASAFTGGHECSTYSGTPAFTAPELSLPKDQWKRCHSLMPAVDVFALGATLYTMVTGHPPWMSANEIVLASKIKNLEPKFKANVDPHLKHIILRMLDKDYVTRITVKELEQHEWVTDEGAEPLYALSEGSLCPPAFGASSSSFEGFNPHGVSSSVSASPEKGISKKLVFEEAHLGTKEEIDDGDFVEKFSPSSASAAGKVEIMPQIDRKHEQGQKKEAVGKTSKNMLTWSWDRGLCCHHFRPLT